MTDAPSPQYSSGTDELFDIEKVLRFHTHSARVFDASNDTVVVTRTLLSKAADEITRLRGAAQRSFDCGEGVQWRRVNDEPYEYAVQQGPHGDEFVKLSNGSCLCRTLVITSTEGK